MILASSTISSLALNYLLHNGLNGLKLWMVPTMLLPCRKTEKSSKAWGTVEDRGRKEGDDEIAEKIKK